MDQPKASAVSMESEREMEQERGEALRKFWAMTDLCPPWQHDHTACWELYGSEVAHAAE